MNLYNGNGEIIQIKSDNEYLTDDLKKAIESARDTVMGYNHVSKCCNFLYLTDLHMSGDGQLMQSKNTVNPYWSLAVVEEICKQHWVEAVVIGGDIINAYVEMASGTYEATLEDACRRISEVCKAITNYGIPVYFVKGNHDLSSKYDEVIGNTEYSNKVTDGVWNTLTRPFRAGAVCNDDDDAGYYYADLSNNVRLCIWNQYTGDCVDSTGSDGDGTSNTEMYWFRDNAYVDEDGKIIVTILHNPTSYATSEFMVTRYYCDGGTYQGKTWVGGNKALCISSHNHEDSLSYLYDGVMTQNVPNFNVARAFAITESTAVNVTIDAGNDRACVSIFTVDTENSHVYETRIGRGESRESDFCTVME